MVVYNKTTNATQGSVPGQNPADDDDTDFAARTKWIRIAKIIEVFYDINVAVAVIMGLFTVLLILTSLDRRLRSNSKMWYIYHLLALIVYTALFLHTATHAGVMNEHRQACFLVMYSVEYVFFGVGINLILINIEVLFTTIMPLPKFDSRQGIRFLLLILCMWLFIFLLVAHLVINNNDGRKSSHYCFYILDKKTRNARTILRSLVPGIICFLFGIAFVVVFTLKRSRFQFTSTSGGLKEVRATGNEDEKQWLMAVLYLDVIFIIRAIAATVVQFGSKSIMMNGGFVALMGIHTLHAVTLYLLPFSLLMLSDVRVALKAMMVSLLRIVSRGKLQLGDDMQTLHVTFGKSESTEHA